MLHLPLLGPCNASLPGAVSPFHYFYYESPGILTRFVCHGSSTPLLESSPSFSCYPHSTRSTITQSITKKSNLLKIFSFFLFSTFFVMFLYLLSPFNLLPKALRENCIYIEETRSFRLSPFSTQFSTYFPQTCPQIL